MTNPRSNHRQERENHSSGRDVNGDSSTTERVSRLAPSPTGALHLGNLRTFLINWAMARQRGWRLVMRLEDLDGPRIKPESVRQTLELLQWVGIDWDGDVLVQSEDLTPYRAALERLAQSGAVFACELSRREVEDAMSAPHGTEHNAIYPRSLRPPGAGQPTDPNRSDANYRLIVGDDLVTVDDELVGRTVFRPEKVIGDFVVWTRRGVPAYQLAVVVDDVRQHVTDVVRGDDLLSSAARQQLLYESLAPHRPPPTWWHLPLVLGHDGRRLAKRHGDTRLAAFQASGASPDRIVGLLAQWCGLIEHPVEMTSSEFLSCFRIDALPMDPVIFRAEDEQWLNGG